MSRLVIIASLLAFAVPAALAAPPAGQQGAQAATPSASELCKQQRRTIGMDAFRALYAPTGSPKAAMAACLAKQVQTSSTAAKNAAMQCKAEQADPNFAAGHGGKSFATYYGKNDNDKNAYGKCVSSKTREDVEAQHQATLNAAKKCKAERAQNAQAFATKYGTNANKRNAFGKCVSKLAAEQDD
jgi:hypothetical protein